MLPPYTASLLLVLLPALSCGNSPRPPDSPKHLRPESTAGPETTRPPQHQIENKRTLQWMESAQKSATNDAELVNNKMKVDLSGGDGNRIDSEISNLISPVKGNDKQSLVSGGDSMWLKRGVDWMTVNLIASSAQILPTYQGKNVEMFFPVRSLMNKIVTAFETERSRENSDCNSRSGLFVNLCGECVGGKTEKDADYGIDACGVCGGHCKDDSKCPIDASDELSNCTRLERVEPAVIDLAAEFSGFVVTAGGECPGPCALPDLICTLSGSDGGILGRSTVPGGNTDTAFFLNMAPPGQEGNYQLCCTAQYQWCQPIIAVNSSKLVVVSPSSRLIPGQLDQQIVLDVTNLMVPVGLVCYLKSGDEIYMTRFSHNLFGNKLNSKVVCPVEVPDKVGNLTVGVSYSFAAIKKLTGTNIELEGVSPLLQSATVSPESNTVIVRFDRNLGLRKVGNVNQSMDIDCSTLFSPDNVAEFGKGATCFIHTNQIIVKPISTVRLYGMPLELLKDNPITCLATPEGPPAIAPASPVFIDVPLINRVSSSRVVVEEECNGLLKAVVLPRQPGATYRWSLVVAEDIEMAPSAGKSEEETKKEPVKKRSKRSELQSPLQSATEKTSTEITPTTSVTTNSLDSRQNNSEKSENKTIKMLTKLHISKNQSSQEHLTHTTVNHSSLAASTNKENSFTNKGISITLHPPNQMSRNTHSEIKGTVSLPKITVASIKNDTGRTKPHRDMSTPTLKIEVSTDRISTVQMSRNSTHGLGKTVASDGLNEQITVTPKLILPTLKTPSLKEADKNDVETTKSSDKPTKSKVKQYQMNHNESQPIRIKDDKSNLIIEEKVDKPVQLRKKEDRLKMTLQTKSPEVNQKLLGGLPTVVPKSHVLAKPKVTQVIEEKLKKLVSQKEGESKIVNKKTAENKEEIFIDQEDSSELTKGGIQRRNLLIWKGIRKVEKEWKQGLPSVYINRSMLIEGVEYSIKAEVQAGLGRRTPAEVGSATLPENAPARLRLIGPVSVDPTKQLVLSARLGCPPVPFPSQYKVKWNITANGTEVDTSLFTGPSLRLPPGSLKPGLLYNVTTTLMDGLAKVIAQSSKFVYSDYPKLTFDLPIKDITIGTGHPIIIDASKSLPTGLKGLQVEWVCERAGGGNCIAPGPRREVIPAQYGLQLLYRRGTLPVGKYNIIAKALWGSREEGKSESSISVTIVRGDTPYIAIVRSSTKWLGIAKSLSPSCMVAWHSIPTKGFSQLPSSALGKKLVDPTEGGTVELPLELGSQTNPGNSYDLMLSAECREGSASVRAHLSIPPKIDNIKLMVIPDAGDAFKTKFKYKVMLNQTESTYNYKYGFKYPNGTNLFLYSSLLPDSFSSSLPSGVLPIVKVCQENNVCSIFSGNELKINSSTSVQQPAIDEILSRLREQIQAGEFNLAANNFRLLELSANSEQQTSVLTTLEDIFSESMTTVSQRLDTKQGQVWGSKLLEVMTLPELNIPQSDAFRTSILSFRDQLNSAVSNATEEADARNPSKLSFEPRGKRPKREVLYRFKRQDSDSQIVTSLLNAFDWALATNTSVEIEKKKLIDNIGLYIRDLCNNARDSTPTTAASRTVVLSAERILVTGQKQELRVPSCSMECRNESLEVVIGRTFLDPSAALDGVCVGASYFANDLFDNSYSSNIVRLSGIYRIDILPYQGNIVSENVTGLYGKKLILLRMPVRPHSLKAELQCQYWELGMWSSDGCRTMRQITYKGSSSVECKCPLRGYYRLIGLVEKGTRGGPEPTTVVTPDSYPKNHTLTPTQVYLYTLNFMIDEKYAEEVKGKKQRFETSVKEQIGKQTNLPEESEIFTQESHGHIMVIVRAVDRWVDSDNHFVPTLGNKLSRGELWLRGLSGHNLTLDRMMVNVTRIPIEVNNPPRILMTMAIAVIGVLAVIALIVSIAAFFRWKNEHRVPSFPDSFEAPKQRYLRLHDESTIEAIEQAINSGRAVIDSGIILGVESIKHHLIDQQIAPVSEVKETSLPGTTDPL